MRRFRIKWLTAIVAVAVLIAAAGLTMTSRRLAASQAITLVAAQSQETIPLDDPSAGAWKRAVPIEVPLSAQRTVPPMGGGAHTITVRALNDSKRLYVRLEWSDSTPDMATDGVTKFSDGAAIEYPVGDSTVPALCMGDPNAPVNIWHWKASWQADVERGKPADIEDAHPNMDVDLYPFESEDTFYPSRAAGNIPARISRTSPVDNLLAGSFGTLTAVQDQMVQGVGKWHDGKWQVVFARDLQTSGDYTQFSSGKKTDVAFAVWDGAKNERNGIKSVSTFVTLSVSPEAAQAKPGMGFSRHEIGLFVAAGLVWITAGLVVTGWVFLQKRRA